MGCLPRTPGRAGRGRHPAAGEVSPDPSCARAEQPDSPAIIPASPHRTPVLLFSLSLHPPHVGPRRVRRDAAPAPPHVPTNIQTSQSNQYGQQGHKLLQPRNQHPDSGTPIPKSQRPGGASTRRLLIAVSRRHSLRRFHGASPKSVRLLTRISPGWLRVSLSVRHARPAAVDQREYTLRANRGANTPPGCHAAC